MVSAKSTEVQKAFGKWLDKTHDGPVEITKYDRPAAVLVSSRHYEDLVANYRKVMSVVQLSDAEVALLGDASVATDRPFNLDDLPEIDDPAPREKRRA